MNNVNLPAGKPYLRLVQTCHLLQMSKSWIYGKLSPTSKYFDSTFPQPFKIGSSAIGFSSEELAIWIQAQMGGGQPKEVAK
jgi:prophage regulatory protein